MQILQVCNVFKYQALSDEKLDEMIKEKDDEMELVGKTFDTGVRRLPELANGTFFGCSKFAN